MSTVVMDVLFEDGATFELLEFLCAAEDKTASVTAFIPVTWVGGIGHPKRARLLEDDDDYTVEMTDGEWEDDDETAAPPQNTAPTSAQPE